MALRALQQFIKLESSAGILLIGATALALVVSNSPAASLYAAFLEVPLVVALGDLAIDKPLLLWINDGLMAVFFLLIGLEVKREILDGELSSPEQIALPGVAAVGGFLLPALIYAAINYNDPAAIEGWAIPAATDIAFALGILKLLGDRVPLGLKVFLTSVAIFDDFGAIIVIAEFYTSNLSVAALVLGTLGIIGLFVLNRMGVHKLGPYMLVGLFAWACVLKSGVHATLAGFAVGMAIPMHATDEHGEALPSPLRHLEHVLHPWIAYAIMPIFAFANAGISFAGVELIVLWNAIILHARWGGMIRDKGMAVCAVLGNIVTAFSWFGTNMLCVGLHSYGFMDKAFFWLGAFMISQLVIAIFGMVAPIPKRTRKQSREKSPALER